MFSGPQQNALRGEALPLRRLWKAVLSAAELQVPSQRARGHPRIRSDLPRVRQVLQRSRLPELAHEDPSQPQGVCLRRVREELQSARRLQHARAHPHRSETAPVRAVRQGLFPEDAAQATSADAFRRASLSVSSVPQSLRRQVEHDSAHETPLGAQALPVHSLLEGLHEKAPSQDTPQLPHRDQALFVSELRTEVLTEQQYEDALQEVRGQQSRGKQRREKGRRTEVRQGLGCANGKDSCTDATEFRSGVQHCHTDFKKWGPTSGQDVAKIRGLMGGLILESFKEWYFRVVDSEFYTG